MTRASTTRPLDSRLPLLNPVLNSNAIKLYTSVGRTIKTVLCITTSEEDVVNSVDLKKKNKFFFKSTLLLLK